MADNTDILSPSGPPGLPTRDWISAATQSELEAVAIQFDLSRRLAEAHAAAMLQRVEPTGAHLDDGHRTIANWGRSSCNWSGGEARGLARLAHAFDHLPRFAAACLEGRIGVAQMHAVGQVAANPRVRRHLAEADEFFTKEAQEQQFDDFVGQLQQWVAAADPDGAESRHDRARAERRASLSVVGERAYLDAMGTAFAGADMREVLDAYDDLEFREEWEAGREQYGDTMHAGLLTRTAAQRRFDALVRLFHAAAASGQAGGTEVTVNIVVDQRTFEEHLAHAAGGPAPEPDASPERARSRRCNDTRGNLVDPREVVMAALMGHVRRVVLDGSGVVLDFGRRRRLFTGAAREAVLLAARRCMWPGCDIPGEHSQADHTHPHAQGGATSVANGGPGCARHNPWKNKGYRTRRDDTGVWHVYRPDGTEIGWRAHLQPAG